MVVPKLHSQYRHVLLPVVAAIGAGLLGLLLACIADQGAWVIESRRYLSAHMLLETLSIIISSLIFAVGWNSFPQHHRRNILLASCTFLAVAIFDFSHMLSFAGMPDYVTANDPEKSILFWLAARYAAATGLLLVICLSGQQCQQVCQRRRHLVLAGVLLLVVFWHLMVFFWQEQLPRTFLPGSGLTLFKVFAEYGVILLHCLGIFCLLPTLSRGSDYNGLLLLGVLLLSILSELMFTLYSSVTDLYNLIGHVDKVLAYLLLYRAIFVETVTAPYQALDQAHWQTRAILEAVPDVMLEMDVEGRYLAVHTRRHDLLVAPPEQLLGRNVRDVLPVGAAEVCLAALREAQRRGCASGYQIAIPLPGGQVRHFELSVAALQSTSEEATPRCILLSRDITERMRDQADLRKLWQAVEQSPNPVVITDLQARIEYANQAFCRLTGYLLEEVRGRTPSFLRSGKTPPSTYGELWEHLQRGQAWRGEFINRRKDGSEYHESAMISPILDERGRTTHYLAIKEDITQRKQDQQHIERLAHYDSLTGLPNRALFRERFEQAHGLARRNRQQLALMFIDLDNFKRVNDTHGHRVGDLLLKAVTERLEPTLRREDSMSRQGGDEFMLLLPCSDARAATHVANRMLKLLARPFDIEGSQLLISASIGIALFPEDGQSFDRLAQHADAAMYQAKQAGRNRYCFFTAEMQAQSTRMLALENALRHALERGELHLHYQPQLDAISRQVTGVEALLRWFHPQLGLISPAEFIPLAESSGQILAIGQWVLRTACRQMRQWQEAGLLQDAVMAVNLSAVQLRDGRLIGQIASILQETGLTPACLELEVTEATAMQGLQPVLSALRELQSMGVRLAIDDFGTGYSSLVCIRQFEVHKLKIDRSFIESVHLDGNDRSIIAAVLGMASCLGIQVIAEGVESPDQLRVLQQLGCHEVQGYLFSHPRPADDMAAWLQRQQAGHVCLEGVEADA